VSRVSGQSALIFCVHFSCLCLCVCLVTCGKSSELFSMPFRMVGRVGTRICSLDGGGDIPMVMSNFGVDIGQPM